MADMEGESCREENGYLPEKSFESWGSYRRALNATPARFMNRLMARSLDLEELQELRARSRHEMKKTLTSWDLMCFCFGSVFGVGVFVLSGLEAREDAGPSIVVSFIISGFAAMLSVFCYTEFAVDIPVAGGSFAYIRVELGDFVAFIAAGNILLEYVIGIAVVARSCCSYSATLFNRKPNSFRIHVHSLGEGYSHLDPLTVGFIVVVCVVAIISMKGSSRLNYISTIIHMAIIVFIIVAGLWWADPRNYAPFAPYGLHGIFKASAVIFFSYVGFDAVVTLAEETTNPGRDIPIGLVGSMSIITFIYGLLAITLCLMQPYTSIDTDAPFSMAFKHVGMGWAKYIVALGSIVGSFTVLVTSNIGQARYLTHIARTHMLPSWFAHVNTHTSTPIKATIVTSVAAAVIALFTDLAILSNLLSLSTIFIFIMVDVALLVRRYYSSGDTSASNRNKLVFFILLILFSSMSTSACWGLGNNRWGEYCLTVPIWVLGTWGLSAFVPEVRKPMAWGVPLVPWLPSASIFINIFLLGSIDWESFMRFGVWTVLLLVYYVFVGLHASFDAAMSGGRNNVDENATASLGQAEAGQTNVANL